MTILAALQGIFTQRPRPSALLRAKAVAHIGREDASPLVDARAYLFVNSPQLCVLVEQQELLLVAGGDGHALRDQSHLLLCGQQPVPRGTRIPGPARRWEGAAGLCE